MSDPPVHGQKRERGPYKTYLTPDSTEQIPRQSLQRYEQREEHGDIHQDHESEVEGDETGSELETDTSSLSSSTLGDNDIHEDATNSLTESAGDLGNHSSGNSSGDNDEEYIPDNDVSDDGNSSHHEQTRYSIAPPYLRRNACDRSNTSSRQVPESPPPEMTDISDAEDPEDLNRDEYLEDGDSLEEQQGGNESEEIQQPVGGSSDEEVENVDPDQEPEREGVREEAGQQVINPGHQDRAPHQDLAANPVAPQVTHSKLREKIATEEFNSPITTPVMASRAETLLMILAMAQVNNLTFKAFIDTAKLVNSLFASPVVPNSQYLMDVLLNSSEGIVRYFYCKKCFHSFGTVDHKQIVVLICPETDCGTTNHIKDLTQATYFVSFPIPAQLQLLLSDKKIREKLVNPKEIVNKFRDGLMRDVYDGTCYRDFVSSLTDDFIGLIISFVCSTDGSPLFKSSSTFSIWPFFLCINELPPVIRMRNLLLGGLWFGNRQPPMDLFLEPMAGELKKLSDGFLMKTDDEEVNVRGYNIGCCVDSGARGPVQGLNTHSGYYSCNWCEIAGKWLDKVVFCFQEMPPKKRTHEDMVRYAGECVEDPSLAYVYGVHYLSPLAVLPKFDLVNGMIQDFAHNVPFGIARTFLQDWLTNTNRGSYIGSPDDKIDLDERMMQLTPPIEIRRRPRKMSVSIHWNAREYENWTLIYSLIVLKGILPLKYLKNWSYLAQASFLLSRQIISKNDINNAHRLLLHFVSDAEFIYGESFMSYNLHILTHLAENAVRWGPIFSVSTYCFENGIKELKSLLHAHRGVPHQVHRALSYKLATTILRQSCGTPRTDIFEENIVPKPNKMTRYLPLNQCVVMGALKKFVPNDEENYLLTHSEYIININDCLLCTKIIKNRCVYTSDSLSTGKFINSVAQCHPRDNIIIIKKFIYDTILEKVYVFCVDVECSTFLRMPEGVNLSPQDHCVRTVSHIGRRLNLISVDNLKIVCVKTTMNDKIYITVFPNLCNVF